MRILGIDPGLNRTGWGVIECRGKQFSHLSAHVIAPAPKLSTPLKLAAVFEGLTQVIQDYQPCAVAVEKIFVNVNPASTLQLGLARGVCLLVPALSKLTIAEYEPTRVKSTLVGQGRADKKQVAFMVGNLLGLTKQLPADASDALAVALTHAFCLSAEIRLAGS